jgi:hypothetical protein
MSARERIESLTNSWYGYALFTSLLALLDRGIGLFSLFFTAMGLAFSVFVTWFLGNRLLARSGLWRTILLGVSLLASVFGLLGTVKLTGQLFTSFSMSTLFAIGAAVIWLGMNVQSFRTLTDPTVKSYFN